MLINTQYRQNLPLSTDVSQLPNKQSKTYRSFLNHEKFYMNNCFSFMCLKRSPQSKTINPDGNLNSAVSIYEFNSEKSRKKFHNFKHDIIDSGAKKEKKWKCPYCNRWWPVGEPCKYKKCPRLWQ